MEVTNITNNALNRYFESLTKLGYSKNSNVLRLLVLSFVEELMTGELSYFITEKDYLTITNALQCISGDCLIPFPSYSTYDDIYRKPNRSISYRITEDDAFRSTEDLLFRAI